MIEERDELPTTTREKVLLLARAHVPPVRIAATLGVTTAAVYAHLGALRRAGLLPPKIGHYYPETLEAQPFTGKRRARA